MVHFILEKVKYKNINTFQQIELDVQARRTNRARTAIRLWLRTYKDQEAALLQACDWYRRLGLFRDGFRRVQASAHGSPLVRLWEARFLNLVGATDFAVQLALALADEPTLATGEASRILGNIHLSDFDYARARRHFEMMRRRAQDPTAYLYRLGTLGLADSLAGQGELEPAIEIARKVAAESSEHTLKAVAFTALGEYQLTSGKNAEALASLSFARRLLPVGDRTNDAGFLHKWLGVALYRQGRAGEGRASLEEAFSILARPGIKAETWLDVLRLRRELGDLSALDSARLAAYPGLSAGFRRRLSVPTQGEAGPADAALRLALDRGEFANEPGRSLALPLELRLLGLLRRSHPWTLSRTRLKMLLWPGEAGAFLELEGRLQQLLHRATRCYGILFTAKDGELGLAECSAKTVHVTWADGTAVSPPEFLRGRSRFRPREVREHYGIGATRTCHYLSQWRRAGWISPSGQGAGRVYLVEAHS